VARGGDDVPVAGRPFRAAVLTVAAGPTGAGIGFTARIRARVQYESRVAPEAWFWANPAIAGAAFATPAEPMTTMAVASTTTERRGARMTADFTSIDV
jgi:hypothetical protein